MVASAGFTTEALEIPSLQVGYSVSGHVNFTTSVVKKASTRLKLRETSERVCTDLASAKERP